MAAAGGSKGLPSLASILPHSTALKGTYLCCVKAQTQTSLPCTVQEQIREVVGLRHKLAQSEQSLDEARKVSTDVTHSPACCPYTLTYVVP